MQLAFTQIDRSAASAERVEDLLSAAESHLPDDSLRALYFANEALLIAEAHDQTELELRALGLIIDAMKAAGRVADATPYIIRAIDLAGAIDDAAQHSSLVDMLGAWAIDVEQEPPPRQGGQWASVDWAKATIARLERMQEQGRESAPSAAEYRPDIAIDDPETGLLNALGLAAELLSLEESRTEYALIQVVLSGHEQALLLQIARRAAELVGDRGLVARNADALLTAVLPSFTGIAAMAMAEHLRVAFTKLAADADATIGIGVAIKQPAESSRDVLRRVADRAEEAAYQKGVTVAG